MIPDVIIKVNRIDNCEVDFLFEKLTFLEATLRSGDSL